MFCLSQGKKYNLKKKRGRGYTWKAIQGYARVAHTNADVSRKKQRE